MLSEFATEYLRESLEPGTMTATGNTGEQDAPYGLYRCAGDDQWCAVTVRDTGDWQRLCKVIGAPDLAAEQALQSPEGRVAARERIDGRVADWTMKHSPDDVMHALQSNGVPAGVMLRVNDLRRDPHLRAREFFTILPQPQIGDIPTENGPARFGRIPAPPMRPAPLQGENTWQIARELLALDDAEIKQLCQDGVLQDSGPAPVDQVADRPGGRQS
jgi:crotonobetainyl-CoA:carnitine CoA-transferase CaiB-like acyl-CoA transferase